MMTGDDAEPFEVRRHQIELLAEIASWGVDGIDLNFLHGPVYVLYEQVLQHEAQIGVLRRLLRPFSKAE